MLNPNPKTSRAVDPQYFWKIHVYFQYLTKFWQASAILNFVLDTSHHSKERFFCPNPPIRAIIVILNDEI
jgi:hypothetical protein